MHIIVGGPKASPEILPVFISIHANLVNVHSFLGPHELHVDYDEVPVPGSPFPINVVEGCDPSKVKAYGPGIEQGTTNKPAKFTVDTRGAGTGGLGLAVEGPSDAKISCTVSISVD